jgi:hypothetical protein
MKKKIVVVSILIVTMFILLPSISAFQLREIFESKNNNSFINKKLDYKDFSYKNEDSSSTQPQFIISFFILSLISLFRLIRRLTLLMPFLVYVLWACILWIIP